MHVEILQNCSINRIDKQLTGEEMNFGALLYTDKYGNVDSFFLASLGQNHDNSRAGGMILLYNKFN